VAGRYDLVVINLIVAVDEKLGVADDTGIPWKLPSDKKYFREKTKGNIVIMGYVTYLEFDKPLPDRRNVVVSRDDKPLKSGFEPIKDVEEFAAKHSSEEIWIIGGAKLFAKTIKLADRLYITRLLADFHSTKFFPEYESNFYLENRSQLMREEDIDFYFEVWGRKKP
jgi:dihydrofolate reductase